MSKIVILADFGAENEYFLGFDHPGGDLSFEISVRIGPYRSLTLNLLTHLKSFQVPT